MGRSTGRRIARDYLWGVLLGGIAAALVWELYPGFWKEPPDAELQAALQRRAALRGESNAQPAASTPRAAHKPQAARGACDFEPIIPAAGPRDGHATMEHPFPAGPRARAKVFERAAKAALASGRTRDAEVTLIAACRENAKASSRPNVPLARVHSALGELYAATSAQSAPAGPEQSRLLERARQAFTLAAGIYAGALGPNASRSRQALLRIERLDSDVLEIGAQNAQQQTRREVEQQMPREAHHASREAVPLRQVVQERQRSPVQDPPSRTVRNRSVVNEPAAPEPVPSVRSLVQADPELRQFEADLARLHEQAAAVSEDPEGLRHRSDLAQAQRNHCRDTACLRRWYVRRRAELIEEF